VKPSLTKLLKKEKKTEKKRKREKSLRSKDFYEKNTSSKFWPG